jgi:signal transduction histidine kinase/CheY-like chemotaxis protein
MPRAIFLANRSSDHPLRFFYEGIALTLPITGVSGKTISDLGELRVVPESVLVFPAVDLTPGVGRKSAAPNGFLGAAKSADTLIVDSQVIARSPVVERKALQILLVEDNAGDARLLREMFGQERPDTFNLIHVLRMNEAEIHLAKGGIDVVLLDMGLPDEHGLDTVRRAQAAAPDVPVIVLTGLDDEVLASEAMMEGAQDYLIKGQIENRALPRALRHAIERHRMQAEADHFRTLESRARVSSVLECTSDSVLMIDHDWIVLYGNRKAIENLPDFQVGNSYWNCFPDILSTPAEQHLRSAMEGRSEIKFENYYSPYEQWYRVYAFPTDDGLSIFFSNITEEKKIRDQLELEQVLREKRIEALSHMAGGLAHEISNPLAIIHGRANDLRSLAAGGVPLSAIDVLKACDSIVQTSDRAMKILRGLRGFAREASQDPMQSASLNEIAEQCIEIQHSRFDRHDIELRMDLDLDIPDFLCRETQIGQIVTNLLNNAFDAIIQSDCEERWISLKTDDADDEIYMDVTDSGSGIEDHFKAHLMEPFFTTKEFGLGMGVGLSLSRAIAQDHGGTLTLRNDTKNTCFRLVLPINGSLVNQRPEPAAIEVRNEPK